MSRTDYGVLALIGVAGFLAIMAIDQLAKLIVVLIDIGVTTLS